ncbi:hypothetical protein Avbf_04049 [Armadillidium vulgare]|nr:hypothetical protein Avbf_04049 [Armadillidium vulgare]
MTHFYFGSEDDIHMDGLGIIYSVGRSNFFNKRSFKGNPLKRTKSVTKLERNKRNMVGVGGGSSLVIEGGTESQEHLANNSLSRIRSSRSHESLLSSTHQQMMHTLDMAAG